jgi:hypothetical protein
VLSALLRLIDGEGHHLHVSLGLGAPTGAVDIKGSDGRFTHYGMQLGSGTWDFLPGLTYAGNSGPWSWGAQTSAIVRLEDLNDSGFRFGDQYQGTLWLGRRLTDAISASARIMHSAQGTVGGHYNGPHNHSSPPDLQANYGGDFTEVGIGLNLALAGGALAGNRLGIEAVLPVRQDVNGFQQKRESTLFLSWALAF